MDKFLFTDGTNGVKEAHSKEELLALVQSATNKSKIRVWPFRSNAWITWPAFLSAYPECSGKTIIPFQSTGPVAEKKKPGRLSFLLLPALLIGALLIFNFTRDQWTQSGSLSTTAIRPLNVPLLNTDSLASEIEMLRGKALDKSTRHNLRLRNNWPEWILLHLRAEKETKGKNARYQQVMVSVDNASGLMLDEAIVKIETWKNGKPVLADTLSFKNIRYDKVRVRTLQKTYRADSLSLSFLQIRAKAFNFCYLASSSSQSGNPNDRWFCRDGKLNP